MKEKWLKATEWETHGEWEEGETGPGALGPSLVAGPPRQRLNIRLT